LTLHDIIFIAGLIAAIACAVFGPPFMGWLEGRYLEKFKKWKNSKTKKDFN